MKRYSHKFTYHFVYIVTFLMEFALMAIAWIMDQNKWMFVGVLFIIFIINLIAYIRQISYQYGISEQGICRFYKDQENWFYYQNMKSVRKQRLYLEIVYSNDGKYQTLYISKWIRQFKDFEAIFDASLKHYQDQVILYEE